MLDNLGNVIKWDGLLQPAIQELKARHPDSKYLNKLYHNSVQSDSGRTY